MNACILEIHEMSRTPKQYTFFMVRYYPPSFILWHCSDLQKVLTWSHLLYMYSPSKPYINFILKDEGKGVQSRRGRIFGVWWLFWCPLVYILYLFVVNVENKIHMVNITCWLQLKYKHNLLILHESNIWSGSRSVGHGHIVNELM